jgi:hypothetical protein
MRLRKFLIAGSALAAAAAFTLIPAAQASSPTGGNIGSVRVGANTTGNYAWSGVLKSGTSVTMDVFGSPTKLTCTDGDASGRVYAASPNPDPSISFSELNLTCDSFIPDEEVTMEVPNSGCAKFTGADNNVHDGLTDTGPKTGKFSVVDGTFTLPAGCPVTVTAGLCVATIGGSTPAQFDEDKDPGLPVVQNFILKGSGLTVLGANFFCFGAINPTDTLTINQVELNFSSASGDVDYRDN